MSAGDATVLWALARGAGIAAILLLTATMVLGVLTWSRVRGERWPRVLVADVHRNLSVLALAFVALHLLALLADAYSTIAVSDLVVPFASAYRPIFTGAGVLSLYALLVVAGTTAVRRRLGYRTWRAVHLVSYAGWPLAFLHALGGGSESGARIFSLGAVALGTTFAVVVVVRAGRGADARVARAGRSA